MLDVNIKVSCFPDMAVDKKIISNSLPSNLIIYFFFRLSRKVSCLPDSTSLIMVSITGSNSGILTLAVLKTFSGSVAEYSCDIMFLIPIMALQGI